MRPIFATFRQLALATADFHRWRKAPLDRLHDLWLKGAPSPDSRILQPAHYDPRHLQPGNVEKRLVLPTALAQWIHEMAAENGMPLAWRQSLNIALGQADLGLDLHDQPLYSLPGSKGK